MHPQLPRSSPPTWIKASGEKADQAAANIQRSLTQAHAAGPGSRQLLLHLLLLIFAILFPVFQVFIPILQILIQVFFFQKPAVFPLEPPPNTPPAVAKQLRLANDHHSAVPPGSAAPGQTDLSVGNISPMEP